VNLLRFAFFALLVSASLTSTADPKPWFIVDPSFEARPNATAYYGEHAGSGYQIEVPDDWNGELVLYAHGYRGEGPALTVSSHPIRDHLLALGYAWAASSYSSNSYVPGIGAKDTHKLIGLFAGLVANPSRVYLMGHSMGGHVTGLAVEQWPESFAGAVPMCGVMGDSELFDYFQDVYLVGETLIGNVPAVPTPGDYSSNGLFALFAALSGPAPGYPTSLSPAGETFKKVLENLTGGKRPTFEESFSAGPNGGTFILGLAGTGNGRENLTTVYQFDDDPALSPDEQAFNDTILRLAADPQFRRREGLGSSPGARGNTDSPPITGNISIPVISLHTIGELFVPFHMEQIYAERVAAQGRSDLLVSRAIRDVIHCGFTSSEMAQAFDDLVNWVENGVRPGGDDILNPATVAADDFGCTYTEPGAFHRSGAIPGFPAIPACP
jgi:pimeloyl-ACP methyl ester carboxylesterase